jgi:hypothetical protein
MGDREGSPSDQVEGRGYAAAVVLSLLLVVSLVALPFVPLLLSLLESMTLGTQRVEELCRDIGIHDELSALYQAVFNWFR